MILYAQPIIGTRLREICELLVFMKHVLGSFSFLSSEDVLEHVIPRVFIDIKRCYLTFGT